MTKNFFGMNGTMYFLPEDASYLETSYVSEQIADDYGLFRENPKLTIKNSFTSNFKFVMRFFTLKHLKCDTNERKNYCILYKLNNLNYLSTFRWLHTCTLSSR